MEETLQDLVARLRHCRTLPEIREVCGELGGEQERVRLLTDVLGSNEVSIRWKAAVALSEMGPAVVENLIGCLSDPRSCVRSSAAWILGNIGDIRAVPFLQRHQGDLAGEVRKEADEALGKIADRRSGTNGFPQSSLSS